MLRCPGGGELPGQRGGAEPLTKGEPGRRRCGAEL
jgi:hypothetical protein